jgi:hypothetical protein
MKHTWLIALLLAGCSAEPPLERPVAARAAPAATPSDVRDALDALDGRAPVPLLPHMAHHQKQNMRDHLVAVQEIAGALAAGDYPAVERAAGRIGYSDAMGQMCTHMGAGAPGFADRAVEFHRTADGIARAARAGSTEDVLRALDATLRTCTSCHATWKQHVVDEATFGLLAAPSPH